MIVRAPLTCAGCVALGVFAGLQWNAERIAVLQERLDFKEEQRLDAERRLTNQQALELQSRLGQSPSGKIRIEGGDTPLARQLGEIFSDSGWSVEAQKTAGEPVLMADPQDTDAVLRALKESGVEFRSLDGKGIIVGPLPY